MWITMPGEGFIVMLLPGVLNPVCYWNGNFLLTVYVFYLLKEYNTKYRGNQ